MISRISVPWKGSYEKGTSAAYDTSASCAHVFTSSCWLAAYVLPGRIPLTYVLSAMDGSLWLMYCQQWMDPSDLCTVNDGRIPLVYALSAMEGSLWLCNVSDGQIPLTYVLSAMDGSFWQMYCLRRTDPSDLCTVSNGRIPLTKTKSAFCAQCGSPDSLLVSMGTKIVA